MAFKKTLAQRLFTISSRLSTPSSAARQIPPPPAKLAPDPRDDVISRRFLQWRQLYQSAAPAEIYQSAAPAEISPARGGKLLERLRGMGMAPNRIRLDGLSPPEKAVPESLTVEDARKVLRVSQLEVIKSKIREMNRDSVFMDEFVEICSDNCGSRELGLEYAKMLDESGHVIVLGKLVFLRPDKEVVKVIQGLMPSPGSQPNDPRWKELEEMEKQKSAIDRKAESLVRQELWCGLGFLIIQTAAFMRLTFWELTWDVMEPICFYVTSAYFMASYAFFLRTKIEPSFEGFFQSRFNAKQKRLMKKLDFDVDRYNELLRAFYSGSSLRRTASLPVIPSFDQSRRAENGAFH